MSEIYKIMSLGDLIDRLDEIGTESVRGLGMTVFSYRGYYERHDVHPDFGDDNETTQHQADALADAYRQQIGKTMHGYKGGDYTIRLDEAVYCAGYGSTGPAIIGLTRSDDGVHEPILCDVEWW